jgi:hypothetical protein
VSVVIPFGCQYVSWVGFVRGLWVYRAGTAVSLGTSFVDRVPPNSTIRVNAYPTFCWLLLTSWLLPGTLLCHVVRCVTHKRGDCLTNVGNYYPMLIDMQLRRYVILRSTVTSRMPFPILYQYIFTIFLLLLTYFSEFIYCSLNDTGKHFGQ